MCVWEYILDARILLFFMSKSCIDGEAKNNCFKIFTSRQAKSCFQTHAICISFQDPRYVVVMQNQTQETRVRRNYSLVFLKIQ